MKLIMLAGLVAIEKIELAQELAVYYQTQGTSVLILDNIARLPMNHENFSVPVQRIAGDITIELKGVLQSLEADIVLLAVSEQVHPENLFIMLEDLSDTLLEIEIRTLVLIDLRTCDCFPNVREILEQYADMLIQLPYKIDEVLNHVGH
jgi:hypothetical protein